MARAFGARDIALGIATVAAQSHGGGYRTLLAVGVFCDAVDCGATILAGDRIPDRARLLTAAVAAGAALNGLLLLARACR